VYYNVNPYLKRWWSHNRSAWCHICVLCVRVCDMAVVVLSRLQARQSFGVVELDGLIYVLGGETKEAELITVEVFDPHCSAWKLQTSMTMIRKVTKAYEYHND